MSDLFCARVRWANDTASTPKQEQPSGYVQQLLELLNKPFSSSGFTDSHCCGDLKTGKKEVHE